MVDNLLHRIMFQIGELLNKNWLFYLMGIVLVYLILKDLFIVQKFVQPVQVSPLHEITDFYRI